MIVLAVLAAAVIAFAIQQPLPGWYLAPIVPLGVVGLVCHLRSRMFLPLASLALAVTPFPANAPRLISLGGRSVFLTDLILPAVAVVALRAPQRTPDADRAVRAYAFIMTLLLMGGLLGGVTLDALIQDARGPLYLVCGYLIASRLLELGDRRAIVRTVGAVLWWSTAMIMLSLFTGTELLAGRVGEAQAFAGGAKTGLDAVRFLIASKELALVAVVACLSTLLIGQQRRLGWRGVVGIFVPGLIVVFMAFSRQSVLGVAAGLLVILIASPLHVVTARRLIIGGAAAAVAVGILGFSGLGGRVTDPDQSVLGKQVNGFNERVIGGLFGENLVDDPGNQFRSLEIEAARDYALDHPLVGGGLGVTYRGQLELEAFNDVAYGARYVHNVYLWYAVKGGLLGLVAIAVLLGRPLVRVVIPAMAGPVPHREEILALGAALVAVIAVGLVEPVIHLTSTGPLVGAMIGALGVLGSAARTSDVEVAAVR